MPPQGLAESHRTRAKIRELPQSCLRKTAAPANRRVRDPGTQKACSLTTATASRYAGSSTQGRARFGLSPAQTIDHTFAECVACRATAEARQIAQARRKARGKTSLKARTREKVSGPNDYLRKSLPRGNPLGKTRQGKQHRSSLHLQSLLMSFRNRPSRPSPQGDQNFCTCSPAQKIDQMVCPVSSEFRGET
jgi:hypothetical protein